MRRHGGTGGLIRWVAGVACAVLAACSTPVAVRPGTTANTAAPAAGGFDQTLSLQGVTFRVSCSHAGSLNRLRVEPRGLQSDNGVIESEIDGTVSGAEVADLDSDGSPELYVYTTSAGSGSYGGLAAWAANRHRSLSQIYLPPLTDDAKASVGYMGHDEFRVVENRLVRSFPVYAPQDANARPTGGTRQLQYKLKPGEASWILEVDRVVNY